MAARPPRVVTATVLWCDLDGFVRWTRGPGLARLAPRINAYYEAVAEEILSHGGGVNRYVGDSVLAVFGGPVPSPEPELQAVSCAMSLKRRVERVLRGTRVSVGVATGPVLAGEFGHVRHRQQMVFGPTLDRAIILERQSARRGFHVCLDAPTYGKLKDEIRAEREIAFSHPLVGKRQKAYQL